MKIEPLAFPAKREGKIFSHLFGTLSGFVPYNKTGAVFTAACPAFQADGTLHPGTARPAENT